MIGLSEITHRASIPQWLNERGLHGCGVEVGAASGIYSDTVLSQWNCSKFYVVDHWLSCKKSGTGYPNEPQEFHNKRRRQLYERLKKHGDKVVVLDMWSHEAVLRIKDSSLDFAFVDCCHAYPWAVLDLYLWYPKLRVEGLFAGHDYVEPGKGNAVKIAVDELALRVGADVSVIQAENNPGDITWAFVKTQELPEKFLV